MAALTPTSIQTDGQNVADMSSPPIRVNLTLESTTDTYTFGRGLKAWAFTPDATDLHTITESAGVFSIASLTGTAKTITLFIWASK